MGKGRRLCWHISFLVLLSKLVVLACFTESRHFSTLNFCNLQIQRMMQMGRFIKEEQSGLKTALDFTSIHAQSHVLVTVWVIHYSHTVLDHLEP